MNHSSKRLAIFIPALYGGGAERSILNLAGGIAKRSYNVDLVLARQEGPLLVEVPNSIRMINLQAARDLQSLLPLVHYLRRERPDALLAGLHTNIIALWARRFAGHPNRVVVSERNTLSIRVKHYAADLRMRLMPLLVKSFYPWANCIVAVSKGVAEDLIKEMGIPPDRVCVIYNPIVTLELKRKAHDPLEHPWLAPHQPSVILAVGRLTAAKDFKTLIQAFDFVSQTYPAKLLILGEGEDRADLEDLVRRLGLEAHVSLPGYVINPYPYMMHASLFVLSSRWEGLPGVLIEALYCGIPIIATDCPSGPREILADGKYGRLIPVGNVEAMAKAILASLQTESVRPPQESWQAFEEEHVIDQYIEVLFGESA